MKKLLIIPLLFLLYSCSPSSQGNIHQDEKGCPVLTNNSSSQKITFVLKFNTPTDSGTFEQTVGPKEDVGLGVCSPADQTLTIIGGYIKSD